MPALKFLVSCTLCVDNSTYTSQEYHRIWGGGFRHPQCPMRMQLFDPSMLALLTIQKQNSDSVGLFTRQQERELVLDRHETQQFFCCQQPMGTYLQKNIPILKKGSIPNKIQWGLGGGGGWTKMDPFLRLEQFFSIF